MATYTLASNRLGVLAVGLLAVSMAAMTFGAGIASADPNDPGMTDVRPDGSVHSREAAATSGAKQCATDPGTLGTSSTHSSDVGVPMQTSHESGPSWVGSHGWQANGTTSSNPWRGNFNKSTKTGPQCKTGHANSAGSF